MSARWQYLAMLAFIASSVSGTEYTFTPFKRDVRSTVAPETPQLADYSLALTQKVPRSANKKNMLAQLTHTKKAYTATLEGAFDDEEYLTSITIGGQLFETVVDTGSSDTWVPAKGFQCVDFSSGQPLPESACAFGTPGFDPSSSSTYEVVPDKNFNITYGSGSEFLTGTVAKETVTVGGMTVEKQIIGIGTHIAWQGDGVSTGLMGLALPDLTSVYNGTNPDDDSVVTNKDIYNPLFFSAIAEGVVSSPYFSMALNRGSLAAETNSTVDPDLGYLAFGGRVDVPVTNTSATSAIQGFTATGTNKTGYFWYTIDVDSYNFPGAPTVSGMELMPIIDSGTDIMLLPITIAQAYNEAMDPPAINSEEFGGYVMACDATAPPFSITIGGKDFPVSRKDIFLPMGITVNGTDLCFSGIQPGDVPIPVPVDNQTLCVLGVTFLHNVVVTFNVEALTLTITERELY